MENYLMNTLTAVQILAISALLILVIFSVICAAIRHLDGERINWRAYRPIIIWAVILAFIIIFVHA